MTPTPRSRSSATTRTDSGGAYKPLTVITKPLQGSAFETQFSNAAGTSTLPRGVAIDAVREMNVAPKRVYEPGHPDADRNGYVSYPGINPVSEMVNMMNVTRAYEADLRALNAAKSMALKALEIGGR